MLWSDLEKHLTTLVEKHCSGYVISDAHADKTPETMMKSKEELHAEMEQLAETVDTALKAYDENDDGYILYGEFYRYTHDIILSLVCLILSIIYSAAMW